MRTISSGVKGLDEVLGGGFFRPSVVLIAGGVGTGKTTLALQILFNAARERGGNAFSSLPFQSR